MRRVLIPVAAAVGLAGMATVAAIGPAFAQAPAPSPAASAGAAPAVPGKKVCTVTDDRLTELSGLVATADGYIVVNDSTDFLSRERVFFLGKKCAVREAVSYTGNGPRDSEDLALSRDGKTLWIADTGDNDAKRETIALWRMPADGSGQPELVRLSYPDGAKDAEALLIGADGVPVIITKGAKALLYKPSAALRKGTTTPMTKVGEVTLPRTGTTNPLGPAGRVPVTGAAAAPDGSRVVLRTYADAFEWDVKGGDLVAELTGGQPRVTPLPDEPWGESISYSPDGASFLTVSETAQQEGLDPVILRYTPAKAAPKAPAGAAGGGDGAQKDNRSFIDKLDLSDITALIGGVGLLGVLLVVAGVIGIVMARRRQPAGASGARPDDELPARAAVPVAAGAAEYRREPRYGPDQDGYGGPTGSVYGDRQPDRGRGYGADYGPDHGPDHGPVYGGGRQGGGGPARGAGAVYGAGAGDPDRTGGGDRTGGAVYGGGGYRSGRDGAYGGGDYRADDGYPGQRGGRYSDDDPSGGYAERSAGNRYPPAENGYSRDGGYEYGDRERQRGY
jgi:hypothetical protein